MKVRLDWLNRPYPIMAAALLALGATIVSSSRPAELASARDDGGNVAGDDRPDPVTAFLILRGWEEPPSPGDLTPVRPHSRH